MVAGDNRWSVYLGARGWTILDETGQAILFTDSDDDIKFGSQVRKAVELHNKAIQPPQRSDEHRKLAIEAANVNIVSRGGNITAERIIDAAWQSGHIHYTCEATETMQRIGAGAEELVSRFIKEKEVSGDDLHELLLFLITIRECGDDYGGPAT